MIRDLRKNLMPVLLLRAEIRTDWALPVDGVFPSCGAGLPVRLPVIPYPTPAGVPRLGEALRILWRVPLRVRGSSLRLNRGLERERGGEAPHWWATRVLVRCILPSPRLVVAPS